MRLRMGVTFFPTITSLSRPEPSGGGEGKVGLAGLELVGTLTLEEGGVSRESVLFDGDGGNEACCCWLTRLDRSLMGDGKSAECRILWFYGWNGWVFSTD